MIDPYVYKGTSILINTLNIKNHDQLEFAEKEITTVRLKDIARGLLRDGFYDTDHFKQFHRYIFGDIYPWAGEFRTINIFKNEDVLNGYPLQFMDYQSVDDHLKWTLSKMNEYIWDSLTAEEQVYHFSRFMSEIWRAHAFREGNTRTTVTFMSEFAKYKEIPLETNLFTKHSSYLRKALVASVFEDEALGKQRNYLYLEEMINDAISQGRRNKRFF